MMRLFKGINNNLIYKMTVKVAADEIIITPSRKRFTFEIAGETFKTQKSLIEKVKSIFDALSIQENQDFIKAFVLTYGKVSGQNKAIKKVYYGLNDCMPSYFTHSKCLHVGLKMAKKSQSRIETLWLLASILKKLRFKSVRAIVGKNTVYLFIRT